MVSKSGTTRCGVEAPASVCRSSTASTSDGRSVIEMMLAPSDSGGSPAATRNVAKTSAASGDSSTDGGTAGGDSSDASRNRCRAGSSQAA